MRNDKHVELPEEVRQEWESGKKESMGISKVTVCQIEVDCLQDRLSDYRGHVQFDRRLTRDMSEFL